MLSRKWIRIHAHQGGFGLGVDAAWGEGGGSAAELSLGKGIISAFAANCLVSGCVWWWCKVQCASVHVWSPSRELLSCHSKIRLRFHDLNKTLFAKKKLFWNPFRFSFPKTLSVDKKKAASHPQRQGRTDGRGRLCVRRHWSAGREPG